MPDHAGPKKRTHERPTQLRLVAGTTIRVPVHTQTPGRPRPFLDRAWGCLRDTRALRVLQTLGFNLVCGLAGTFGAAAALGILEGPQFENIRLRKRAV